MTLILQQDYVVGGTGTPPAPKAFNTACSIGDVLVCEVLSLSPGSPGTITVFDDVNSGNYTFLNSHLDAGTSNLIGTFFKVANAAGTPTVSCTESSAQFGLLILSRYNGFVGTPTADTSMTGVFTGTGTAVSCAITTNFNNTLLLMGNSRTSGSYAGATIPGWTAADGATFGSPTYYAVEATSGTTNNFVGTLQVAGAWLCVVAGIYDAVATDTLPCGTTASGTVVATGTGGLALPAFAVGDCIVVLTMAQTASALTETFNGDGSNAYTHLQVADNHSTEGFILSRYATIVTTPLASPVLQSTFSGSAKLGIAAVKVGSISPGSPFVPGGNAQHLQTTPSGTNSQVSGLTTSANTNIPVTLVAWGLSVNFAGAPTAGSGFTPQGTAWSAFGAPSLTCETQTSSSLIQQQATFTPIGGSDTYTFLDVFNQLSVAFQIIMGQACL